MSSDPIDLDGPSVAVLDVKTREHTVRSRYRKAACSATEEDELVHKHLPLVKQVVGRLAMNLPSHVDKEDLYSAGLIGLLDAIRNYDPACGSSLETYARILTQLPHPPDRPAPTEVRLALYYPMLPHLLWWPLDNPTA